MMQRRIALIPLLLMWACNINAQDPVFSHFYANSIHLNPSLAGVEGPAKYYVGYRNQWPNSGSSFITYQAAFDKYIEKLQGGIGVKVMNDRQGSGMFNSYNVDLMYAYHFEASRKLSFSAALQAGVGQRSFDPNNLTFGDMIDPVTGSISSVTADNNIIGYSKFFPDFAAGFSAFYKNIYGGAAIHHLLGPVVTDGSTQAAENDPTAKIYRKYSAHIGALIPIFENRRGKELMKLSPNLVFIQQKSVQQINYGLDMIYQDFLLGIWTRHDMLFNYGNLIFTVGYSTSTLRFRYSYDIKLSSPTIRLPNLGAHEISLLIIHENLSRRNKHRTIKCPKI